MDRVQFLFKFKFLLEQHLEDLARIIIEDGGKTRKEALSELRRGIENVYVACGIPSLLQGFNNEDIAAGVDEHLFRQPLGIIAAVTPFNFPATIPLWFVPYAIACGNCIILKPSEQTPMATGRLFELLAETGLPKGGAQLVHGGKETVELRWLTIRSFRQCRLSDRRRTGRGPFIAERPLPASVPNATEGQKTR